MQWPCLVCKPTATSAARRTRAESSRTALPPESQRAQWRAGARHAITGWSLKAVAGMSHCGRAPKERGLLPVQCLFIVHGPITTSAARRARAESLRVALSPEKQRAQWRARVCHAKACCFLEAVAGMPYHGRAPKERGLSPVQCPGLVNGPTTTSAARRTRAESSRTALPPERQRAQWRARACHAKAGWFLKAVAGMLHHGRAPKERGLSPVQCPGRAHGPITTSAARRVRAESLRTALPPERRRAQCRARACHVKGVQ